MEEGSSIGLATVRETRQRKRIKKSSNIRVHGGEVCLMEKASMKKQTVLCALFRGFLYGALQEWP